MQSIVVDLVLRWLVSEVVTAGGAANWPAAKAAVDARVATLAGSLHVGFMTTALDAYANEVLDAVAKLSEDKGDLTALLQAVAAKDMGAAVATLKAMLLSVTVGDLHTLLAGA